MSKDKFNPEIDLLNTPIPGQSLTKAPGSAPWENPPKFTDPKEFLETAWDKFNHPQNILGIKTLMQSGATAESIARTFLYEQFKKGNTTPDLNMLTLPVVTGQIATVAHVAGVKDIKVLNEDTRKQQYMKYLNGTNSSSNDTQGLNSDTTQSPQYSTVPWPFDQSQQEGNQ